MHVPRAKVKTSASKISIKSLFRLSSTEKCLEHLTLPSSLKQRTVHRNVNRNKWTKRQAMLRAQKQTRGQKEKLNDDKIKKT